MESVKIIFESDIRRFQVPSTISYAGLLEKIYSYFPAVCPDRLNRDQGDYVLQWKDEDMDEICIDDENDFQEAWVSKAMASSHLKRFYIAPRPARPAAQKQTVPSSDTETEDVVSTKDCSTETDAPAEPKKHIDARFEIPPSTSSDVAMSEENKRNAALAIQRVYGYRKMISRDKTSDIVPIDGAKKIVARNNLEKLILVRQGKAPHSGVFCDECRQPVVGTRFKCASCPSYDLCRSCEAKNVHPFHVLLRIVVPLSNENLSVQWFPRGTSFSMRRRSESENEPKSSNRKEAKEKRRNDRARLISLRDEAALEALMAKKLEQQALRAQNKAKEKAEERDRFSQMLKEKRENATCTKTPASNSSVVVSTDPRSRLMEEIKCLELANTSTTTMAKKLTLALC